MGNKDEDVLHKLLLDDIDAEMLMKTILSMKQGHEMGCEAWSSRIRP